MSKVEWNDEWGTKEENNVLEGVDSLEGYNVGEEIRLTEDMDSYAMEEGEEARIIGIVEVGSAEFGNLKRQLLVEFEGMDPITVDPYIVEGVLD